MDSVQEYVALVQAPWGRMFYDVLFEQLRLPHTKRLNILDFGSGLGVTANHYAQWHDVLAVEPNPEMIEHRQREYEYTQLHGDITILKDFNEQHFDVVFCHNVLEYIEDKEPIIAELMHVLKSGGTLSIMKHNRMGRIFHTAVFKSDPKKAIALLDEQANDQSNYLGTQYLYSNDDLIKMIAPYGGTIDNIYGMRTFYALGQNDAKYDAQWYQSMLALEQQVSTMDAFKHVAFMNHVLVTKL